MGKISDEFADAVCDSGSIVIDCELCGRTHFNDETGSFEEGEYEELCKNAEKEPDKYVQYRDESVHWGRIDGRQAVIDCPCDGLEKYEKFIWNNRYVIAKYLKARAVREKEDSDRQLEALNTEADDA